MVLAKASASSGSNPADFEDGLFRYNREGPQRKSAEPDNPLQNILDTLYSEHRYIGSLLDTFEAQAERLKPGNIPDYHLLLDIADYLNHYPAQYHHPREDLLFASLLDGNDDFEADYQRLEHDHNTLHHYAAELLAELTEIVEGRPVNRLGLQQRIKRFIKGYREHIEYENHNVFPLVKGRLTPSALKALKEKTRFIDDPLFGREVQSRYVRLQSRLESGISQGSQRVIAAEMSGIVSLIEKLDVVVSRMSRVKSVLIKQQSKAWRQQLTTIGEHARFNQGPKAIFLPVALMRNNLGNMAELSTAIREALIENEGEEPGVAEIEEKSSVQER